AIGQRFGNVQIQDVDFCISRTNFVLSLMVFPDSEMSFILVNDERRFSATSAQDILEHLRRLLIAMVERLNRPVSQLLSLAPVPQRHNADLPRASSHREERIFEPASVTATDAIADQTESVIEAAV